MNVDLIKQCVEKNERTKMRSKVKKEFCTVNNGQIYKADYIRFPKDKLRLIK